MLLFWINQVKDIVVVLNKFAAYGNQDRTLTKRFTKSCYWGFSSNTPFQVTFIFQNYATFVFSHLIVSPRFVYHMILFYKFHAIMKRCIFLKTLKNSSVATDISILNIVFWYFWLLEVLSMKLMTSLCWVTTAH